MPSLARHQPLFGPGWRQRLVCRLRGHEPEGPYGVSPVYSPHLEAPMYVCSRCEAGIRFLRDYPNGWVLDPPLTDIDVDRFLENCE